MSKILFLAVINQAKEDYQNYRHLAGKKNLNYWQREDLQLYNKAKQYLFGPPGIFRDTLATEIEWLSLDDEISIEEVRKSAKKKRERTKVASHRA